MAFAMKGNMKKILAMGFNGYISKPLNINVLKNCVHSYMKEM